MPDGNRHRSRRIYAHAVVFLRFLIVPAWLLGAFAAHHYLPSPVTSSSLAGALPASSRVARANQESEKHFLPLLSETVVVQHKTSGLSRAAQANTLKRAASFDLHPPPSLSQIAGAVPLVNTAGAFPSARQHGTTALTYLVFKPSVHPGAQDALATRYARRYLSGKGDALVGVTGPFIDENAQAAQIAHGLPAVQLGVIALVIAVVGLAFRSVLAPVVTLMAAGCAYYLSQAILGLVSARLGTSMPAELQPLIVVLVLGVVTDYSVFFLSGFKDELSAGRRRREASLRAITNVAPLVITAGITVAASVAVIVAARVSLFADLGPGLAISVIVTAVVAVSFVPAALSLLGRLAYWPSHPGRGTGPAGGRSSDAGAPGQLRARLTRFLVHRPVAAVVLVLGVGALVLGTTPLQRASVGLNLIRDLPSSAPATKTANAAGAGFAPGIIAPTQVLLHGPHVADHTARLVALQRLIASQKGVAGVIGPGTRVARSTLSAGMGRKLRLFRSPHGNYARYLVVFSQRPYDSRAIADLKALESKMGSLLARAGLAKPSVAYAGDTAAAAATVSSVTGALVKVGLLALAVDFFILMLFLRSVSTPLLLVTASALVVATSFGLATWVFKQALPSTVLGSGGFTFYVPFASEVLLIAFGSDYNLFLVGRIWELTTDMPLRRAIAGATAEAGSAINIAGAALAASFAMLALVNLGAFRQMAFIMVAGLLIDTFFVRSLLVPASLSLMGRLARWPSSRNLSPRAT